MSRPFRYTPVSSRELKKLPKTGLSPDRIWFNSLKKARAAFSNKQLLIVPAEALEQPHIDASAVLNAQPYRPPVRMVAGGGVLIRPGPDVLVMFRRDAWDLPKGKRDPGETNLECAVREVKEEIGIKDVTVVRKLGRSEHTYPMRKRQAVKITHWYIMRTRSKKFVPQLSEGIQRVEWVPLDDAIAMVGFNSLRNLLTEHRKVLSKLAGKRR